MIPKLICWLFGHRLWIRGKTLQEFEDGRYWHEIHWLKRCSRCGAKLEPVDD